MWRGKTATRRSKLASATLVRLVEAAAISCETRFTIVFAFDIALLTSYRKLRRDPYRDSDEALSETYRYSYRRSCIASHIAIRITFNSDPDRLWGGRRK